MADAEFHGAASCPFGDSRLTADIRVVGGGPTTTNPPSFRSSNPEIFQRLRIQRRLP
jgi:hypothetical protein